MEAGVSDGVGHLSSKEMSFGAIIFSPSLGRSLKNKYYIIGFSIFGTLFCHVINITLKGPVL